MNQEFSNLLDLLAKDEDRNQRFLHLTPNEPAMSQTARQFLSSKLNDRYYFGPGKEGVMDNGAFTSLGLTGVGQFVAAAEHALKEMLGAGEVNLNCLSGVHAMMCVLLSVTQPGDTVMSLNHDHGGHFATKGILNQIGRKSVDTVYDYQKGKFDAAKTAKVFHDSRAKVLYLDVSYHTDLINVAELRQHLGDDALIVYDASHAIGLMMGAAIPSPLAEGADVICANTHKTLPGPQKGLIAYKDATFGKQTNSIINSCLFSSTHTGSLLALATTILEMKQHGQAYAQQIVSNSQSLSAALVAAGFKVRRNIDGSYSKTHQVHLIVDGIDERRTIYDKLYANSIAVAFDSPSILHNGTFIRLGTQEVTRYGMTANEMQTIAGFIRRAIDGNDIKSEVENFKKQFATIHYSFDAANFNA